MVWQDYRNNDTNSDIYGARINSSGTLLDTFAVSFQSGQQISPALVSGQGNQLLITYTGWLDSLNTYPVKTMRIWGKFYPFIGIEEERTPLDASSSTPEIYPNPAKGVMRIRIPLSVKEIKIFDVSGKLIKEIASATLRNDGEAIISLKGINPGIYFLRVGKETKKFLVVK